MAAIVFGALLVVVVMAYQGIHILRTGQIDLFFLSSTQRHIPSTAMRRLSYALIYLLPSVLFALLVAVALERSGTSRISNWIADNYVFVIFSLSFTILGWFHLVRPADTLRWTLRDQPEVAERASALFIARLIGVAFIAIGIAILSGD